ncbi:MAG: multinuclear nonheme iron-dependent oxidase [Eubacteriales bacterium]
MKIACNYYTETEQLFDEGRIDIDYFKYPGLGFQMSLMENLDAFENFCDKLTLKRPVLLHGLYPAPHDLSSRTLQQSYNDEKANRLIKMTNTPGLSFHPALSKLPDDVPFDDIYATIAANAKFIKEKYADMEFVSIENTDNIQWRDLIDPQVIKKMLDETCCDFLLDISHAYCAAKHLCINFYDYLKKLPLEKTIEIHINGWVETESDIMSHTKTHDAAYGALQEVLGYCSPKIVTVEYGRHNDRIGAGVPVLSLNHINEQAKYEIEEQIYRIRKICG